MKTDPLFPAVEAAAPQRGRILDLGCGYGLVAHWLTLFSPDRTVHGVDFDTDKIRAAQATARENPRATFELGNILEYSGNVTFDGVLLCDVLHYLPRPLKAELLARAFRALRPGGCLIVRDAFRADTRAHELTVLSEKWGVRLGQNLTASGLHFESAEGYLALLREAGFAEVETRGHSGHGSNRLMMGRKKAS